jgi:hypothetical protein
MPKSQPPPEGRAKAGDSVEPGSMERFKALTRKLFDVDPVAFNEARQKDEKERREKRDR